MVRGDPDYRSIRAVLGGKEGRDKGVGGTARSHRHWVHFSLGTQDSNPPWRHPPPLTEDTDVSGSLRVAKGAADMAGVPGVVVAYRT